MARYFVGINFPSSVALTLELLKIYIPGAKWVSTQNLHTTLFFIGDYPPKKIEEVIEKLETIKLAPFNMAIQGVDAFSSKRIPRILYAKVVESDPLLALRKKVVNRMRELGIEVDKKKYIPHVTLARLKNVAVPNITEFLESYSLYKSPEFLVSEFHLFSSHRPFNNKKIKKNGQTTHYIKEYSFPLSEEHARKSLQNPQIR